MQSALQLEVFTRTPWTVYAGADALHHEVRWVHPNEIPDIARFLRGGEMLLTAGTGIGRTAKAQAGYIAQIAAAGAAVLVIELSGRAFNQMPAALVEAAEKADLPLVGLHGEIPFVEVSAQVHDTLVDERLDELTSYERLNQALMGILVSGRDHVALTEALSQESGYPAVLETSGHKVLVHASATAGSDALVRDWGQHARLTHDDGVGPGCTRRAVTIRGEHWGWLHLFHDLAEPRPRDIHALERTSDAIAIRVLTGREDRARSSQRESALVSRLMLDDITGEAFVSRALRLGKDLRRHRLVVVWGAPAAHGGSTLAALFDGLYLPSVIADSGDTTVAVVGFNRKKDEQQIVHRLNGAGIAAGLSRPCSPPGLSAAFRQARNAFAIATGDGQSVRFDDLGILRLLAPLAQGPELGNYVEDELGALFRHDTGSAHPLLPTLRAFVAAGGNKSRAAQALFVQRRTLYYRLGRIGEILGCDIEETSVLQNLTLAIRGLDLLHEPTTGRRDQARP